jgi:hypothetical protein
MSHNLRVSLSLTQGGRSVPGAELALGCIVYFQNQNPEPAGFESNAGPHHQQKGTNQ